MKRLRVFLVALALLCTGCATAPTSGPVEAVPLAVQPPGIDVAPEPPAKDVQPSRLVEGFLQAMADPSDNYAVARQYLTPDAAEAWQPTSAVVYQGIVTGDESNAGIAGTLLGKLESKGHFAAETGPFDFNFKPVEVGRQWRISNAPDGLLLSAYIFERYYAAVSLYFMAPTGTNVVPDPIHLHESRVTPTTIVEALIAGPGPDIAPSVSNAIPSHVSLGAEKASLDVEGVATVDLVGLSDQMSEEARRRLGAELIWSLTALPRMTGLVVTNSGTGFRLPGANAEGVLELAGQQGYQVLSRGANPDLYGVRDGTAGRLNESGTLTPVSPQPDDVDEMAASLDGVNLAFVSNDRAELRIGSSGSDLMEVETGLTGLRHPQYLLGTLWVIGERSDGSTQLIRVERTGAVKPISVEMPEGLGVTDFSVSPSEARIAVIAGTGRARTLGIVALLADGVTTGRWRPLDLVAANGVTLTEVQAVAWHAEVSLSVVATSVSTASVFTANVDGSLVEDIGPVAADQAVLTAMPRLGGGSLAIRNSSGTVWRYEPRVRWAKVADDVATISYSS